MHVTRKVSIKTIVTEDFKKELDTELKAALERVNASAQRLQFQMDAYVPELAKTDMNQAMQVRRAMEAERQKFDDLKKEINSRLEAAKTLGLGSEYDQGEIESVVELKPGDNFDEKVDKAEIVLKDGKVQEIRGD